MAEKKLGVKLTAKDRLSKTLKGAGDAARKAGTAMSEMAVKGARAVEGLTRKLFFLKEAVNVVANAARGLWDTFLKPALDARKMAVSLTNVFGSGTAQKIKKFSADTGLAFQSVSRAALDMEDKLGQAGGLDAYLAAIERVNKWRPDLGAEGAIAFVNDLVNKVTETTEGSSKQLGQYTSVVVGGTKGQAVDLAKELDKLGVVSKVVDPTIERFARLREAWNQFVAEVGDPILDKLADAAANLLDWLTKNKDQVIELASKIGDLLAGAVQKFVEMMTPERIDSIVKGITGIAGAVGDVVGAFTSMPDWAKTLLLGGGLLAGTGAGRGAVKGVAKGGAWLGSKLAGGGAAAAGSGGTAAAGAAGGLSALGVGASVFGGLGLGLGVNEAISRTKWGQEHRVQSTKNIASVGAYGLGKLFGGEEKGQEWFSKISGIQPGQQKVQVEVSVADDGAIKAYVANEGQRRNAEIFSGAGGTQPSYGWR